MRIVALVLATGCSSLFGLEEPRRRDASIDSLTDSANAKVDGSIDTTSGGCPANYTSVGIASPPYRMITDAIAWIDAAALCAADGGTSATKHTHLAVIRNDVERANLAVFNNVNNGVFWLGLSDRVTDGQYLWVTAENTAGYPPPTGAPWAPNEPSGTDPQDCIATGGGTTFQDALCDSSIPALCECDDFVNDASRY